jgi:hypothetical protein
VDHKILSRPTANGALKQAGLPKHFQTRHGQAGPLLRKNPRVLHDEE